MKFSAYSTSFTGLKNTNNLLIVALLVAVLGLLIMGEALSSKKPVVIIRPYTLTGGEIEVGEEHASPGYLEAWGMFMAQALGSVDPRSEEFLKAAVEPLLAPKIYRHVLQLMEQQIQMIKRDGLSMFFQPYRVVHEKSTNKIFVEGMSTTVSEVGMRRREVRTYEFTFIVRDYRPALTYINTYEGVAQTKEEMARRKEREEAVQ